MAFTYQSDFLKLASVYLKRPESAFISQVKLDNDWESLNYLSCPDYEQSIIEYQAFEKILSNEGVQIYHFPEDNSVGIDSIYCRDASIATDHGMILCSMGKAARITEPQACSKIFNLHQQAVLGSIQAPGKLEGGDVTWLDNKTLAVAHSYRTNYEGIRQLKQLLLPHGINILIAELPHFRGPSDVFHLMSIISPVDKNLAVVYSPLMPIHFRNELLTRGYELIEVPEAEFDSMGCNVLAIGPRHCLMVDGNPETKAALEKAGCNVLVYKGAEISLKGGGGPTCLTRPMHHKI